jgi:hypothetical protein
MFFYGGFARTVAFAKAMNESYFYPYYAYNFYVNADYENLVINEEIEKSVPGFFKAQYGINVSPNTKEIIEPDGKMFILRGPPFTFQMFFWDINHSISYFSFKKIYLIKDSGDVYDLSKSDNMYFRTNFTRNHFEYDVQNDDVENFIQTKVIDITGLIALGKKELEKNTADWTHSDTINKEQLLDEGLILITIGFRDLPIEVKTDEKLIIGFDFDVIFNNGEIHNFVFEDIYKKKYQEIEKMHSFNSPEKFGKNK